MSVMVHKLYFTATVCAREVACEDPLTFFSFRELINSCRSEPQFGQSKCALSPQGTRDSEGLF